MTRQSAHKQSLKLAWRRIVGRADTVTTTEAARRLHNLTTRTVRRARERAAALALDRRCASTNAVSRA
jgi:hypothetical protein